MISSKHGTSTLAVEVLNISNHGIWVFVVNQEYFLPYENYPWFENATVKEIYNVELLHKSHLYWASLDVDLELEALKCPENHPFFYKETSSFILTRLKKTIVKKPAFYAGTAKSMLLLPQKYNCHARMLESGIQTLPPFMDSRQKRAGMTRKMTFGKCNK